MTTFHRFFTFIHPFGFYSYHGTAFDSNVRVNLRDKKLGRTINVPNNYYTLYILINILLYSGTYTTVHNITHICALDLFVSEVHTSCSDGKRPELDSLLNNIFYCYNYC